MFWLTSLSLLGVVALGPQVVLASSFKFNFSAVEQCEPVIINFSGRNSSNHFLPTQLTILPYVDSDLDDDSDLDNTSLRVPIQISIPNGASNSTGIDLSFIPIPAYSRFVAALDDGQGSAKVSDVTPVGNNSANSSCLSSNNDTVEFYRLPPQVKQCESFNVTYTTTSPPTIIAFTPRGNSFEVMSLNSSVPGQASFVMNGQRNTQVVLLLNNTENEAASSRLMTIGGDSGSSKMCFANDYENDMNPGHNKMDLGSNTTKSFALPKPVIIGIAVGTAVIVFAALLLLWYILRRRKRQRLASNIWFNPSLLNRRWPPDENEKKIDLFEPETQSTARWRLEGERVDLFGQRPLSNVISPSFPAGDYILDPPYTNDKYRASVMTGDGSVRTSISSWNQFIPEEQRGEQIPAVRRSSSSSSRLSLNTVDIQPILQMTRVHDDSDSGRTAYQSRSQQGSTAGTASNVSKPAAAILVSSRRAQRTSDPPDIPDIVSAVSRNNSASVAALTAVPVPYMSTSYTSFGGDSEDASGTPQAISGGNGIGDYPVPRRALVRSDSSG